MPYKDASKLKRSSLDDLTEIETAEFRLFASIEVDALMARLAGASKDFKQTVAQQLVDKLF